MNPIFDNAPLVLSIAVAVVWFLFLLTVFRPSLIRRIAWGLRNTWLARAAPPEYSFLDIRIWSRIMTEAMLNITKAYDWRFLQWSGFSTALLTATLAFVSAVVVEYFKDTILTNVELKLRIALLGILASVLVYIISQRRISRLKIQFLEVCTWLQLFGEE